MGRRALLLYPPSQEVCGAGTAVGALAVGLESEGWDVVVGLALGHRFHDPRHFRRRFPQVRTVLLDGRTGSEEGRVRGIEQAIRRVGPDVVVQTMMQDVFEAVRRLRRRGQRFSLVTADRGSLASHTAAILENRDVVDAVVCINRLPALAIAAVEPSFPAARIRVIPNCVPGPLVAPARGGAVQRIGYAGRLSPDKRAGDLFAVVEDLIRSHPHLEFWVAGGGPLAEEVRRFCGAHPGNVRFFEAMSREDLYRGFYCRLDLCLHFSPAEGWCNSIAEAMAHGVVPVTSAFAGGIRAEGLLTDGVNAAIFPVGDVAGAARRIRELCADPELWIRMGLAARETFAKGFTPARFARAWSGFLAEIVAAGADPAAMPRNRLPQGARLEWAKETARRLLRRRFPHAHPGEEWPQLRGRDPVLVARVAAAMDEGQSAAAAGGRS